MNTIAQLDGDMIVSRASGDIVGTAIPADLVGVADDRLRFDRSAIVALDDKARDYWIDDRGQKHIVSAEGWQKLKCRISDRLMLDAGTWRVFSAEDALAEARSRARAAMVAFADGITARLTSQYPAVEVASWPTQQAEAAAVLAGANAAAAPLLAELAGDAGKTLTEYAQRVLDKAAGHRQIVAAVKAIRDATEAAIEAATTPEAVASALGSARASATARAQELGLA